MQTTLPLAALCGASLLASATQGFSPKPGAMARLNAAKPSPLDRVNRPVALPQQGRSLMPLQAMRAENDGTRLTSADFFTQASLSAFLETTDDTQNRDWMAAAAKQLDKKLGDSAFPCPFGRLTHRRDIQKMVFVNQDAPESLQQLRDQLAAYTDHVKQDDAMFRPLVVVFKPEAGQSLKEYHAKGWAVLQHLHDHDVADWPSDTPRDTEHYLWSFCFNGVQLSVNMSNPAQQEHKARNLGDSMVLVFNPRKDFDVVAGDSKPGRQVRETIRQALSDYEGLPPSDTLGTYGDPNNLEWRQYASEESAAPLPKKCPITTIRSLFNNNSFANKKPDE